MPTSTCRFLGKTGEHELTVKCGFFGNETFLVDGKLVHSHFSLRFTGERQFSAEGRMLTVRFTLQSLMTRADVFVDGKLVGEDLFADFNQSMTGDVIIGKVTRTSIGMLVGGLAALAVVIAL